MSNSIKKITQRIANRVLVRDIACLECEAAAGTKCQGVRHPRTANHQSRWDVFRAQSQVTPGKDEGIAQAMKG